MAKKLFEVVMETLKKNGMAVDKETAKAIRSHFNMTQENVSEKAATFCGYAGGYAAEAELDDAFVASHLVEALKATKTHDETVAKLKELAAAVDENAPEEKAVDSRAESEPANTEDQDFVEAELAAEDEANDADAVGESIGLGETCAVVDSTMPVGPLAQNPMANVVKPNAGMANVIPATIKKDAAENIETEKYWDEFIAKYPNKNSIDKFAVLLAKSAWMIHGRAQARAEGHPYSTVKIEDPELVDLLFNDAAENDYLRRAALKKPFAKVTAVSQTPKKNWKDNFDKFDIVLSKPVTNEEGDPALDDKGNPVFQEYKLRIWVDKTKATPTGMIYTHDGAKAPFMKFYWGFDNRSGLSFPVPRVQKKKAGEDSYDDITKMPEFEFAVKGIHKFLVSKNYTPKRTPGAVKPGITMQHWGCGVMNS